MLQLCVLFRYKGSACHLFVDADASVETYEL